MKFLFPAAIAVLLTAFISCKTTNNTTTTSTEDRFAQADRNDDGKLSQDEANDYFVGQIFAGADQNRDGQVTWN